MPFATEFAPHPPAIHKFSIRCFEYIKLSKYNQHSALDVPTIGIQTLKNLKKYNYEGLFIEKNNCIILEKDKSIDFCNNNNLFLATINKID